MIPEHEVIEQIEEEPLGRCFDEVCSILRRLGRAQPHDVLARMAAAGQVFLSEPDGTPLPRWRQAAVFRGAEPAEHLRVFASEAGSREVHGRAPGDSRPSNS